MPTSTANNSTTPPTIATATVCRQCRRSRTLHDQGEERETEQHADGEVGEAGRGRADEREQQQRGNRRRPRSLGDRHRIDGDDESTPPAAGPSGAVVTPVGACGLPLSASVTSLLYGTMPRETRSLATDVEIDVRSIALVSRSSCSPCSARGVIVAARRPLGWAVASVIAASFLAPLVERLAQHMRRALALHDRLAARRPRRSA